MGVYRGSFSSGPAGGQGIVIPPVSAVPAAVATWPVVNTVIMNRFVVQAPTSIRYINFRIGVSSGNVQVGVVSLAGNGNFWEQTATLVASSGVIACPATNADYHRDLGAVVGLAPGDYALFFWADNTTMSAPNGVMAGFAAARASFAVGSLASGVTGTHTVNATTRWVAGLTAELV